MKRVLQQSFESAAQHRWVSTQPLALPPSSLVLGMLQVMGISPTAAQAVARVVSSIGERPPGQSHCGHRCDWGYVMRALCGVAGCWGRQ